MCVCVVVSDINGVLRSANATEYGLAAGVFTTDISKALQVSDRLLAGTIFINTYNKTDVAAPFGGYKQSGFGKDLGEFVVCCFRSWSHTHTHTHCSSSQDRPRLFAFFLTSSHHIFFGLSL